MCSFLVHFHVPPLREGFATDRTLEGLGDSMQPQVILHGADLGEELVA